MHSDTGLTNAELGLIHEFGTRTLPERSFVRSTLRAMQSSDGVAAVDLYDRLGQMARRGGHRLYSEA